MNKGASNLIGITSLLNSQYLKDDIDLGQAERDIINKLPTESKNDIDPIKDFTADIDSLLKKVGIDDDNESHKSNSRSTHSARSSRSSRSSGSDSESGSSRSSRYSHRSRHSHRSGDSDDSDSRSSRHSRSSRSSHSRKHDHRRHLPDNSASYLSTIQEEPANIHELQVRKTKALMQIKGLMAALENDGIAFDGVNIPSESDELDKIESVLTRLKVLNNSNRTTTVMEEILVGGANIIEYVFDGTKKIPGTDIAPDYTNYSRTLEVRMRSMRYETSEIVTGFFERNNFGSAAQLAFSLLPGFLLYPRVNKQNKSKNSISKDPRFAENARMEIGSAESRYNFNKNKNMLDDL